MAWKTFDEVPVNLVELHRGIIRDRTKLYQEKENYDFAVIGVRVDTVNVQNREDVLVV